VRTFSARSGKLDLDILFNSAILWQLDVNVQNSPTAGR